MTDVVRRSPGSIVPGSGQRASGTRPRLDPSSEPVYLASQLASICDVDLKTIHNWCHRVDEQSAEAALESFRTAGGHLRFHQSAVLKFLKRWGYPTPDALLRDRPHVLVVEGDRSARLAMVEALEMIRPGDDAAAPADPGEATGLWMSAGAYLHLWSDPYEALIGLGERAGAGATPDVVVLGASLGEGAARWIRAARGRTDDSLRIVTLDVDAAPVTDGLYRGPRGSFRALLAEALGASRTPPSRKRAAPTRRIPIAPREPIFVASQVASLWGVDLKTVHGWVESGDVEAFRTPGGHLRFRRRALLDLLRRFHMPIPSGLGPRRPMVLAVVPDAATVAELALSLGDSFDLISRSDPMAGLAEIGTLCSGAGMLDAVVVSLPAEGIDDQQWIRAVRSHPDTKYGRVVVLGGDASQQRSWQALGVAATLDAGRAALVRPVLERVLGIG
jgi:hypothetical protein